MTDKQRPFLPGRNRLILNIATVTKAIEEYLNNRLTYDVRVDGAADTNVKVVDIDGENGLGGEIGISGLFVAIEPADAAELRPGR